MSDSHYSETYFDARQRFRDAASARGADLKSYRIGAPNLGDLTMDVAIHGAENTPTIVTSSAVHGVEGFFGSAVQHAFLGRANNNGFDPNIRFVHIHGVNPFGFSSLRRFNEDNVDLNRNFPCANNNYQGAPDGYARLSDFLNPKSPPSAIEPFKLKAMWNIWRHGLQSVKQAVAGGQYEFPRGIFFGGAGPCESTRVICDNADSWIGQSERIVHIDFHSGLGAFGDYKLLLSEGADWYVETFGKKFVEASESSDTAYDVTGGFSEWMLDHFASRDYRFVTAEFGTYDVVRVLGAIRAENRAHHFGCETSKGYKAAKAELLECFCPRDSAWRNKVIVSSLRVIDQATQAVC